MKAIKLIFTFALILGGVVGAFFLFSNSDKTRLTPPPDTTYQTYREQFEEDWEQAGDWDEQLFLSHCDLVQQLSKKYETATLNDLNTKTATEVVYKKIFEEWESPSCAKDKVERYKKAIEFIESKDNNAKTDPNVKKIMDVYATYISAHSLAHQSIGLSPTFNGENWNSYSSYSSSVTSKRNSMLANSNYKEYLSSISDIKNGLDRIPTNLDKGRTLFYQGLAKRIYDYFSRTEASERNKTELVKLRNAKRKFENEYHSDRLLSELERKYADDVANNEKRENE